VVDCRDALPPTDDLAAEMEVLVPRMRDALGDAANLAACTTGSRLSAQEAMELGILTLRRAAEALD
jgi:enoyl-CoA hydratase/carnithine racemase